jgi:hypothetical protein
MLIKSLSRKSGTFKQLFNYINKGAEKNQRLGHNLNFSDSVLSQFIGNDKFRPRRKNGVFVYHEILSFNAQDKEIKQEEILSLAQEWLNLRASKSLAYGVIHTHQENIHIHLMISANEIRSKKKVRLSIKEFNQAKVDIEKLQIEKYPHLKNSICQQSKSKTKSLSHNEFEKKRRGKAPSKKEILKSIIAEATQEKNFEEFLKQNNIEIYKRGKNNGVIFEDKKYRFATLGFDPKLDERVLKQKEMGQQEKSKIKVKTDREKNIEALQKLKKRDEKAKERDKDKDNDRDFER